MSSQLIKHGVGHDGPHRDTSLREDSRHLVAVIAPRDEARMAHGVCDMTTVPTPAVPLASSFVTRSDDGHDTRQYSRLRQISMFQDDGFELWTKATLGIAGLGTVGSRLALETVRSGASVCVWDFDVGQLENLGTQCIEAGMPKVKSVVDQCQRIRSGSARGWQFDICHAGIRELRACDVLLDCTDDPDLAWNLTEISNGVGRPLLRCALDASGQRQFGRVLCSAGDETTACQLCSYSPADLQQSHARIPCPGSHTSERPPTLAGGPLAATIAGLALLQAQRLVTGYEKQLVLGREILVDWTDMQVIPLQLQRSCDCLSGHRRWQLDEVAARASDLRVAELLDLAREKLNDDLASMSGYLHPLNTRAVCDCGASVPAVGTDWAVPPSCSACKRSMRWQSITQTTAFDRDLAQQLGILDRTLESLGYPERGAMFTAKAPGQATLRMLLE